MKSRATSRFKLSGVLLLTMMFFELLLGACGDNTATTSSTTSSATTTAAATTSSSTTTAPATTTTNPATTSGGPKTKVVFWSNDRHDQPLMQEQIAQFNKENKDNLEIEYQIYTEDYPNLLQLAWQSKQGPDIFISRPLGNMPTLVKAGYVEPLDSYLSPEIKNQIGQSNFVEGMTAFNGKLYSLPTYASTFRLIYNLDLFKKAGLTEPPKTLTQLIEDARKLTEAGKPDGAYGFAINLKTPSNAWNRTLMPVATRSGVHQYDYKTGQYNYLVDKPILQAFRQIVIDGSMFPSYQSLDIDPLRSQFAEGKIGMYMSISAEVGVYATQFKPKIQWAAAPVPTIDDQPKSGSLLGRSDWLAMSAQSKNKAAAWKVMQWFYRPEFLVRYQEEGYGNLVMAQLTKQAKPAAQAGSQYFIPDFKNADANWPIPPTVSKVDGKDDNTVFAEYVLGVNTDLDKALNDLTARYNKALQPLISAGTIQKVQIPDFDPTKLQNQS